MKIKKIINQLDVIIKEIPLVCITLGSGLNSLKKYIKNKHILKYDDIKHFFKTNVHGHNGEFIFGYINDIPILCANGRFHYYEGYSFQETGILQQIFNHYNPKISLITNSSGCLRLDWNIGDFMISNKIIDYSYIKSSFPISYKTKQNNLIISSELINYIHYGTYTYTIGPTYETLEEIKDIQRIGGDAVGMSTFSEFLMCEQLNMNYTIISCLTNYGAGIIPEKVRHADVLKNAHMYTKNFSSLIIDIISNIK